MKAMGGVKGKDQTERLIRHYSRACDDMCTSIIHTTQLCNVCWEAREEGGERAGWQAAGEASGRRCHLR